MRAARGGTRERTASGGAQLIAAMQLPLNLDRATLFYDAAASRAVLVSSAKGEHRPRVRKFRAAQTREVLRDTL